MYTNPSSLSNSVTATAPSAPVQSSRPSRTDRIRTLSLLRGYRQSHSHHSSHTADSNPARTDATSQAESNAGPRRTSDSTTTPLEIGSIPEESSTAVEGSSEPPSIRGAVGRYSPQLAHAGLLTEESQPSVPTRAISPLGLPAIHDSGEAAVSNSAQESSALMARTRAASSNSSSYRGLIPTYTAAALDFARLDRASSNNAPASAVTPTRPQDQAVPTADTTSNTSPGGGNPQSPSIRLVPHHDVRSTRPSLQFQSVSRVVSNEGSVIKVGRYSEREEKAAGTRDGNSGTTGPVGFKSKVVSRRHCEFWCANGQWFIKDVRSSSGTFLNHIRLSQPNVESRPFPVNDGDVVQLGIDFKGGEEMIFRCVKIRVECNRGWQKSLNNFNMATHKNIRSMAKTKTKPGSITSTQSSECSICLSPISPCQSLFVAPCSHVWHFKCIRPILNGHTFPQFLCPNCRAVSDLEAEVDEVMEAPENWEEDLVDEHEEGQKDHGTPILQANDVSDVNDTPEASRQAAPRNSQPIRRLSSADLLVDHGSSHQDLAAAIEAITMSDNPVVAQSSTRSRRLASPAGSIESIESRRNGIKSEQSSDEAEGDVSTSPSDHPNAIRIKSPSRNLDSGNDGLNVEGPTTPRNDAGPFVFDGSGGLVSDSTAPRTQSPNVAD